MNIWALWDSHRAAALGVKSSGLMGSAVGAFECGFTGVGLKDFRPSLFPICFDEPSLKLKGFS